MKQTERMWDDLPHGAKVVIVLVAVVGLIFAVRGCGHSTTSSPTASTSTAVTTSIWAAPTTPSPPSATAQKPEGPTPPAGIPFNVVPGPDGDVVHAKFMIGDSFTNESIRYGAQRKTVDILKYARRAYPAASEVVVDGAYPMIDQYGNTKTEIILNVSYMQSTLSKINFNGIDPETIWDLRDSGTINPQLLQ
jgi:hypothetical protein